MKVINLILFYGFLPGFFFYAVTTGMSFITIEFLMGFIASYLLSVIFDKAGIGSKYLLFANIAIWAGIIGTLGFYMGSLYYDKALHFLDAIFITFIVWQHYTSQVRSKARKSAWKPILVLLMVMGLMVLWEIGEYSTDILSGVHSQGVFDATGQVLVSRIDDTMQDMMAGLVGVIVALFYKKLSGTSGKNKN
jgi:hypothetical protein